MTAAKTDKLIPVPPEGAPWYMEGVHFTLKYNAYTRRSAQFALRNVPGFG